MIHSKFNLILLGMICGLLSCSSAADERIFNSPDGLVVFELDDESDTLNFSVSFDGNLVVENSPMVMTIDDREITSDLKIVDIEKASFQENYDRHGSHLKADNHYNEVTLHLKNIADNQEVDFDLVLRLFDNAAAFQLIIPGDEGTEQVPDEMTSFTIPEGSTVWHHDLRMHYESVHKVENISQINPGDWMAPPVTYKLPGNGGFAAITEACLKNYSGMAFQMDNNRKFKIRLAHHQPTSYPYELRYSEEDVERLSKPARVSGTITTPWRVILVGKDLNSMVNNDVVHHLNPAPDKDLFPDGINTSWIKPGRAVWKYLDGGGDGSLETMKKFTDQAAELGFEHNILEGFWRNWSEEEIRDLVSYGNERGVGTWLWKHSNTIQNKEDRMAFFRHCSELGIAGVKLDFFDHEAKDVIDLYQNILRETAELKLLVNFHGANKPTGESRTWPNELTREAIRGMEARKIDDKATHNTTVPFTRFLAGHAEYTPMHFGERRENTTWAHQIASGAIMNTPLLTYAANPERMLENPAVEMIKSIPSVWDETIVLPPSEIGEMAVFARRSGNTWFLAVMSGTTAKSIEVPLSFLKGKEYTSLIVKDDPEDDGSVSVENGTLEGGQETLRIDLNDGGGFIAKFSE
ncbi:glycoside hydrolase family 97 protein [Lunatibacter salilacus]|uniref:glycoside hydrolase family 97 protein n=1 Tax=Lunatibacter salilacus TaxID=2483804 RepID=UPI00131EC3AC|nr:glycoside hydrolase family 97 protein [Lunatibacter salilacus]